MSDRPDRRSVVPIPSDERQSHALRVAAELSEPDAASAERVIERLGEADTVLRSRRRRAFTAASGVAALTALVLVVALVWWRGSGVGSGPVSPESLPTVVQSGYARVETFSPVAGLVVEVRELTELGAEWCEDDVMCLLLSQGEIDVSVGPTFKPRVLRVLAGECLVEVVGTRFTVSRHGERVSVSVAEGTVSVTWPGGREALIAGDHWTSLGSVVDGDAALASGDTSPASPAVSMREPTTDASRFDQPRVQEQVESEIQFLATIQAQRGLGRPADERLDELDRFLAVYPDSDAAEEVLALKVEALTEAGDHLEAINTARDYCLEYESGSHRNDVRWIEATAARDRLHDCELALPPYRELASAAGDRQAEAEYYRGMCAFDTGREDEAREALLHAVALGLPESQHEVAVSILESLE